MIDTNVFISGVLNREGSPGRIINAMLKNQIEVVTSPYMIQELVRVSRSEKLLRYRGVINSVDTIVDFLGVHASIIQDIPVEAIIAQDPDDDNVLACALQGDADYIVSGDRHLLELNQYRGIPILTPAQFIEKLTEENPLG